MSLLSTILKSIPRKMGQVLSWAMDNTRLFMEIMLVIALIVGQRMYNNSQKKIANLTDYSDKLAANLKEQITIKDGQIEILKRNGTKVEHDIRYVPQEGKVIIKYSTITVNGHIDNDGVTVIVKDKGFTLKPGGGAEWGGKGIQAYGDIKWAYWRRYSVLVGGSINGAGPGVSRHLDDFWGHPQNLEIFINYKLLRTIGVPLMAIGVRTNF